MEKMRTWRALGNAIKTRSEHMQEAIPFALFFPELWQFHICTTHIVPQTLSAPPSVGAGGSDDGSAADSPDSEYPMEVPGVTITSE